jgi:hypothetical protein
LPGIKGDQVRIVVAADVTILQEKPLKSDTA